MTKQFSEIVHLHFYSIPSYINILKKRVDHFSIPLPLESGFNQKNRIEIDMGFQNKSDSRLLLLCGIASINLLNQRFVISGNSKCSETMRAILNHPWKILSQDTLTVFLMSSSSIQDNSSYWTSNPKSRTSKYV